LEPLTTNYVTDKQPAMLVCGAILIWIELLHAFSAYNFNRRIAKLERELNGRY